MKTAGMDPQTVRDGIRERAQGMCEYGCGQPGKNAAHRLPRGQQGPWLYSNALFACGSGTTGCHGASERRRALSYSTGWLIRSTTTVPEPWLTIPALMWTIKGSGWWVLDDDLCVTWVDPDDLPMVCDASLTLEAAAFRLHASEKQLRELVPAQREGG